MLVLVSVLAVTFLRLLIFVILLNTINTSTRVGHRIQSGISINFDTDIFTNICVCAFLNTVPLVCGIDASVKILANSNMDNNTTTSANKCTHIFIKILVLVLVSLTLSV